MCVFIFLLVLIVFFFKQKTAYEMRISDWSSDVCSSDLRPVGLAEKSEALGFRVRGRIGLKAVERGGRDRRWHGRQKPGRRRAAIAHLPVAANDLPEIIGADDIV